MRTPILSTCRALAFQVSRFIKNETKLLTELRQGKIQQKEEPIPFFCVYIYFYFWWK